VIAAGGPFELVQNTGFAGAVAAGECNVAVFHVRHRVLEVPQVGGVLSRVEFLGCSGVLDVDGQAGH
jgi:hypothetical protein